MADIKLQIREALKVLASASEILRQLAPLQPKEVSQLSPAPMEAAAVFRQPAV